MARKNTQQTTPGSAPVARDQQQSPLGPTWRHPGGKLRELGASALTDGELLAIIISSGVEGRSASAIAADLLGRFESLQGLCDTPLERLLVVKGVSDVKITRIAAAFELARRLSDGTRRRYGKKEE